MVEIHKIWRMNKNIDWFDESCGDDEFSCFSCFTPIFGFIQTSDANKLQQNGKILTKIKCFVFVFQNWISNYEKQWEIISINGCECFYSTEIYSTLKPLTLRKL